MVKQQQRNIKSKSSVIKIFLNVFMCCLSFDTHLNKFKMFSLFFETAKITGLSHVIKQLQIHHSTLSKGCDKHCYPIILHVHQKQYQRIGTYYLHNSAVYIYCITCSVAYNDSAWPSETAILYKLSTLAMKCLLNMCSCNIL